MPPPNLPIFTTPKADKSISTEDKSTSTEDKSTSTEDKSTSTCDATSKTPDEPESPSPTQHASCPLESLGSLSSIVHEVAGLTGDGPGSSTLSTLSSLAESLCTLCAPCGTGTSTRANPTASPVKRDNAPAAQTDDSQAKEDRLEVKAEMVEEEEEDDDAALNPPRRKKVKACSKRLPRIRCRRCMRAPRVTHMLHASSVTMTVYAQRDER